MSQGLAGDRREELAACEPDSITGQRIVKTALALELTQFSDPSVRDRPRPPFAVLDEIFWTANSTRVVHRPIARLAKRHKHTAGNERHRVHERAAPFGKTRRRRCGRKHVRQNRRISWQATNSIAGKVTIAAQLSMSPPPRRAQRARDKLVSEQLWSAAHSRGRSPRKAAASFGF